MVAPVPPFGTERALSSVTVPVTPVIEPLTCNSSAITTVPVPFPDRSRLIFVSSPIALIDGPWPDTALVI